MYVQDNTEENGGDDTGGKVCQLRLIGRWDCITKIDFFHIRVSVLEHSMYLKLTSK